MLVYEHSNDLLEIIPHDLFVAYNRFQTISFRKVICWFLIFSIIVHC